MGAQQWVKILIYARAKTTTPIEKWRDVDNTLIINVLAGKFCRPQAQCTPSPVQIQVTSEGRSSNRACLSTATGSVTPCSIQLNWRRAAVYGTVPPLRQARGIDQGKMSRDVLDSSPHHHRARLVARLRRGVSGVVLELGRCGLRSVFGEVSSLAET